MTWDCGSSRESLSDLLLGRNSAVASFRKPSTLFQGHLMTMKHVPFVLQALLMLAIAATAADSAAKVYIDIDSPGFRAMPLAVLVVNPPGEAAPCRDQDLPKNLSQVLGQDLEVSGFFESIPPERFLLNGKDVALHPAPIDYRAWSLIGAEALILLQVQCNGEEFGCEAQLLDVLNGKLVVWKRYRSKLSGYRRVAHRFADEVQKELTGNLGPFDTRIAYVSEVTGAKEIYLMDYDGQNPRQVTNLHSISLSPAWSPDSSRIAFTSFWKRNPELYAVDLGRSAGLQALLKGFSPLCAGPAFSPDGRKIAFSAAVEGKTEIFTIPAGGKGKPERLTTSWSINVSPHWSPDEKQMVFVSARAGHPDLYMMQVEDQSVRKLTFEGNYNADPCWSPKGDWIAYMSQVDGAFQIFRIRPDGTQNTPVTQGPGDHVHPYWSPDGRLLVFSSDQLGNFDLYLIRMDGNGQKRLTWSTRDESEPAWSPYMESQFSP
jgi:TolB protein